MGAHCAGAGRGGGRALGGETGGDGGLGHEATWQAGGTVKGLVRLKRGFREGQCGDKTGEGSRAPKLECLSGLGFYHEASGELLQG